MCSSCRIEQPDTVRIGSSKRFAMPWRGRIRFCCIRGSALCALPVLLSAAGGVLLSRTSSKTPAHAWYTQIGAWHRIHAPDSVDAHLFHDASVDGARSGSARAIVRYNRPFSRLNLFSARFCVQGDSSRAGMLVKDRHAGYYFLVSRGANADSLLCIQRVGKCDSTLAAFEVFRADTVLLQIEPRGHIVALRAGEWRGAIGRPDDFPDPATVGFACLSGIMRVWDTRVESQGAVLEETFDSTTLINLHMERMFQAGR